MHILIFRAVNYRIYSRHTLCFNITDIRDTLTQNIFKFYEILKININYLLTHIKYFLS